MKKSLRLLLIEVSWLATSFIISLATAICIFGWTFPGGTSDIHLHDTYFAFSNGILVSSLFILITFLTFLVKEIANRFSRTIPNCVILISGLLLIALILTLNMKIIRIGTSFTGGWTAYPPLSALPETHMATKDEAPIFGIVTNMLTFLQIALIVVLLRVSFLWGQRKQSS